MIQLREALEELETRKDLEKLQESFCKSTGEFITIDKLKEMTFNDMVIKFGKITITLSDK